MSVNGATHRGWRVFNRCSQATLRATMDEIDFPLTDTAAHRPVSVDGVVLRTPGVPRVCSSVRSSTRIHTRLSAVGVPCELVVPVWRLSTLGMHADRCVCARRRTFLICSVLAGGIGATRIAAEDCDADSWASPSGKVVVVFAKHLRAYCLCDGIVRLSACGDFACLCCRSEGLPSLPRLGQGCLPAYMPPYALPWPLLWREICCFVPASSCTRCHTVVSRFLFVRQLPSCRFVARCFFLSPCGLQGVVSTLPFYSCSGWCLGASMARHARRMHCEHGFCLYTYGCAVGV